MAKIAVGFQNGIGNFIMFSSCLQLLASHFDIVDLFLDSEWKGEVREAVELMAKNMPFVHKVKSYYGEKDLLGYDAAYMSRHGMFNGFFKATHKNVISDVAKLPVWADTLQHEIEYYVWEVSEQLKIKPQIFAQRIPVGKKKEKGDYICLANGYLRTEDKTYDKKAYPRWSEFLEVFTKFYPELKIILLGGKADRGWGRELFAEFPHRVKDYTGRLSVLDTAALVKGAKAVICTDSCVMHIADTLRVSGVAMFGPTLCSKNSPWNGTVLPVVSPIQCVPCQGTKSFVECQGGCMEEISPSTLMFVARKILR